MVARRRRVAVAARLRQHPPGPEDARGGDQPSGRRLLQASVHPTRVTDVVKPRRSIPSRIALASMPIAGERAVVHRADVHLGDRCVHVGVDEPGIRVRPPASSRGTSSPAVIGCPSTPTSTMRSPSTRTLDPSWRAPAARSSSTAPSITNPATEQYSTEPAPPAAQRAPHIWARFVAGHGLGAEPTHFCDGFAPRSPIATIRAQVNRVATGQDRRLDPRSPQLPPRARADTARATRGLWERTCAPSTCSLPQNLCCTPRC